MERVNQLIGLVKDYTLKNAIDDSTDMLVKVYQDCSKESVVADNVCEAADALRICILKKRSEYDVTSVGESLWL